MFEVIDSYRDTLLDMYSRPFILACVSFILGSWLTVKIFPVIIHLCNFKNLMDEPGDRKVHLRKIPNLGGVGMYVAFTLAITVLGSFIGQDTEDHNKLLVLVTGVTILFFLGIKDDIIGLSPTKKFAGQAVAALLVIFITDVRIRSMGGLLGVEEIPYIASVIFTLFVFLLVINAFNLVDGIDGLAGVIAVIVSVGFGFIFLVNSHSMWLLVSFALIGSVRGFLKFNLSESQKVFMGDSGSLFVGFVLAYQAVGLLSMPASAHTVMEIPNTPILVLAILSFPLLDTLRVFIIRIYNGRSPFEADRNHIHHRLLDLGLNHKQSTLLIAAINLSIIGLALLIQEMEINTQLLIMGSAGPLICLTPCAINLSEQGRIRVMLRKVVNI